MTFINKIDWVVFTFIAKGLKKVADLNLDAGEKIKLITVSLDALIDLTVNKHRTFYEQEIILKLFEAKYNPQKKKELEELFKPLKDIKNLVTP